MKVQKIRPTNINVYFVIDKKESRMLIDAFFENYDKAVLAAAQVSGIVTNFSWLSWHGYTLERFETDTQKLHSILCNDIIMKQGDA
jgi:hypothetical protein